MCLNNKPIIGVVLKHFLKDELRPNMFVRDEIKQAIFDNNGIAIGIILPKDEKIDVSDKWKNNLSENEYNNLITQINLCDGIVIQGGGACDNYEMIVAKYCYDNNIPTLGICCGQNVMVRALGGTTKLVANQKKTIICVRVFIYIIYFSMTIYMIVSFFIYKSSNILQLKDLIKKIIILIPLY